MTEVVSGETLLAGWSSEGAFGAMRRVLTVCPATGQTVPTQAVMTVEALRRIKVGIAIYCTACGRAHVAEQGRLWLETADELLDGPPEEFRNELELFEPRGRRARGTIGRLVFPASRQRPQWIGSGRWRSAGKPSLAVVTDKRTSRTSARSGYEAMQRTGLRRRRNAPARPTPKIVSAQVSGSGAAPTGTPTQSPEE